MDGIGSPVRALQHERVGMCRRLWLIWVLGTGLLLLGCGESSSETEADRAGVGAECTEAGECESEQDVSSRLLAGMHSSSYMSFSLRGEE